MDASLFVAQKFDELIARHTKDKNIASFTYAERVVWYVIILRTEKDINGFASIFEQALPLYQLEEAITCLQSLNLPSIASAFEEALSFIMSITQYDENGFPKDWPDKMGGQLVTISDRIGDALWDVDDRLQSLLISEQ